jgi:GNAT superfamily N-acetyltransferase
MPLYSIELAEPEDLDSLYPLILNFKEASPYKDYPLNEEALKALFANGVTFVMKANFKIVGFLLAVEGEYHPFLGKCTIASELAWWVEPEHRGHGRELLEAFMMYFEDVEYLTMSALDDNLGKLYESYGFQKNEVAYVKRTIN